MELAKIVLPTTELMKTLKSAFKMTAILLKMKFIELMELVRLVLTTLIQVKLNKEYV